MILLTKCYSVDTISRKELEEDPEISLLSIEIQEDKYIVEENCLAIELTHSEVIVKIDSIETNNKHIPFAEITKYEYEYFNYVSTSFLGLGILILLPFIVIGIGFAITGAPKYTG